ncbi:MAG: hypothetical protein IJ737_06570 [Ruminococcus sp.]|nr:hypothetical protein [Ruminococcus sp.]
MTYMLNSIEEAVDGKYLVTKSLSNQAEVGTMVHIMDAKKKKDGKLLIDYRVTDGNQNYVIKFDNMNQFYKWARPDSFIARHYESFSKKEIANYIKVSDRSFTTFCLPIIAVALVIIWVLALFVMNNNFVIGAILSVVAIIAVMYVYKSQEKNTKLKLYKKVGNANWGIVIK